MRMLFFKVQSVGVVCEAVDNCVASIGHWQIGGFSRQGVGKRL